MSDNPIKPPEQRPEHPDFWCKRFGEGITPWDAGRVPSAFADFITRQPVALHTLIPGCGSAWEAVHLAEQGWPVTALDFSPLFYLHPAPSLPTDLRTRLPLRPAAQALGRLGTTGCWAFAFRRTARRLLFPLRAGQRPPFRHSAGGTGYFAGTQFRTYRR